MLKKMFENQIKLQKHMLNMDLPNDVPEQFYMHCNACNTELQEAIQEDNRWKKMFGNVRAEKLNKDAKLEELVDAQLFLINAVLYSGFDVNDFYNAYQKKFEIVKQRQGLK